MSEAPKLPDRLLARESFDVTIRVTAEQIAILEELRGTADRVAKESRLGRELGIGFEDWKDVARTIAQIAFERRMEEHCRKPVAGKSEVGGQMSEGQA